MMGFGCIKRLIVLALLLVVVAGAWLFRDRIRDAWRDARGLRDEPLQPSQQLADMAAARIDSLDAGQLERASFSEVELQSLLDYRYTGVLPAFVDSAQVELDQDRMVLRARVPTDKLPTGGALGDVASLLPDTTELALTGSLLPLESGRIAVAVDQVTAAKVPLPKRVLPAALERLGRRPEPGLPRDAIALNLPPGVRSAYIRNDSLVLLSGARRR